VDISAAIPPDWPSFWDHVDSAGNEIRITDGAGVLLTHQIDSWNYAAKTGTIEIDNYDSPNVAAAIIIWIYWDNDSNPASGAGSFTISTSPAPRTGTIEIGNPGSGSEYVINARPEPSGATNSRNILAKTASEIQHIWWNLFPILMKRRTAGAGSLLLEEMETATYTVTHSDGTNTSAAMGITGSMRSLHPAWVLTPVQAGTDTANYVVALTVTTTAGRTLNFHTTIKVRDIDAPTP
jgi:hypothetical protein